MNNTWRLGCCLAALVLAGGLACRQEDVRTVEVRVPQMRTTAGVERVREQLRTLRGIRLDKLAFDTAQGTVTVTYDSMMLAHKNIEYAIAAAGFDANEIPADPKARAALPPGVLSNAPSAP